MFKEWITRTLIKKYAGSLIRHGLTWASGALMAASFAGSDQIAEAINQVADPLTAGIVAVMTGLAGLLWSAEEKKRSHG